MVVVVVIALADIVDIVDRRLFARRCKCNRRMCVFDGRRRICACCKIIPWRHSSMVRLPVSSERLPVSSERLPVSLYGVVMLLMLTDRVGILPSAPVVVIVDTVVVVVVMLIVLLVVV